MLAEGISLAGYQTSIQEHVSLTLQRSRIFFFFLSAFCVSQLEAIDRTSIGDYFAVVQVYE